MLTFPYIVAGLMVAAIVYRSLYRAEVAEYGADNYGSEIRFLYTLGAVLAGAFWPLTALIIAARFGFMLLEDAAERSPK